MDGMLAAIAGAVAAGTEAVSWGVRDRRVLGGDRRAALASRAFFGLVAVSGLTQVFETPPDRGTGVAFLEEWAAGMRRRSFWG